MANQFGVIAQETEGWWVANLELRHTWLPLPFALLTQVLGQLHLDFFHL